MQAIEFYMCITNDTTAAILSFATTHETPVHKQRNTTNMPFGLCGEGGLGSACNTMHRPKHKQVNRTAFSNCQWKGRNKDQPCVEQETYPPQTTPRQITNYSHFNSDTSEII